MSLEIVTDELTKADIFLFTGKGYAKALTEMTTA